MALTIWTIGHSSRALAEFLSLLDVEQIERVADVRRYAGSRAHPHFNPAPLGEALKRQGVEYTLFPELGGRRTPNPSSTNTVWRHPAFRAYADYMQTPEFQAGLDRLEEVATRGKTALLCSEAVWWRCHRALIADALKAQGVLVLHIMGGGKTVEHPYTSAARIIDGQLHYGAAQV